MFLLACACSVFLNAGQSSEDSSQCVLIVLDLSCCGNGYNLDARATPVEDRRPGIAIWQTLVWCLRPHRLSVTDWYTLMGASASAVPRLGVWGIISHWKLEEP